MKYFFLSIYMVLIPNALKSTLNLLETASFAFFNATLYQNLILHSGILLNLVILSFLMNYMFKVLKDILEDVENTKVDNEEKQ